MWIYDVWCARGCLIHLDFGLWCPTSLANFPQWKAMNSLLIRVGVRTYNWIQSVNTVVCCICLTQNISSYCHIRCWSIFCCCGCFLGLFRDGFLLVSLVSISVNGGSSKKSSHFDYERLTPRHGFSDLRDIFSLSNPIDAALEISWHCVTLCIFLPVIW